MPNYFAQFDEQKPADQNYFAQFDAPQKPVESRGVGGFLKDTGLDVAKGVVGFGESVVGLGNLASFGVLGKVAEAVGYDPKQTSAFLSGLQSDARQQSDREVSETKGFWNTLGALGTHPDVLFGNIVESLPGTVGAGAVGGMLVKKLAATAATEATALGLTEKAATDFIASKVKEQTFKIAAAAGGAEGAQTAGSIAESGRQSGKDWDEYVMPALAAGLGTAAIGMVSGKIGQKLGIGDVETDIAARTAGVRGVATSQGGAFKRIGGEILKEGALEEMPQSYQEKAFENLATGKPWQEGTSEAAAQGLAAGMGMAGGHAVLTGKQTPQAKPDDILKAPTFDDALKTFTESTRAPIAPADLSQTAESIGEPPRPAMTLAERAAAARESIGRAREKWEATKSEADAQDLNSLVESERRNLQVMQAQIDQDRQKQAELDQIPNIAAEQNTTQEALQRAASLDAPTAMGAAFGKLFDNTLAPEPEAPAAPEPAPEPRIVERQDGMIAMPRELAELRVEMNGGEVVRMPNRNGKYAYTVLADESKPSLARIAKEPNVSLPQRVLAADTEGGGQNGNQPADSMGDRGNVGLGQRPDAGGLPDDQLDQPGELPSQAPGSAVSNVIDLTARLDAKVRDNAMDKAVRQELDSQLVELNQLGQQKRVTEGDLARLEEITATNDNGYNASRDLHKLLIEIKKRPAEDIQTETPANVQNNQAPANEPKAEAAPVEAPTAVESNAAATDNVPGAGSTAVQADGVKADIEEQIADLEYQANKFFKNGTEYLGRDFEPEYSALKNKLEGGMPQEEYAKELTVLMDEHAKAREAYFAPNAKVNAEHAAMLAGLKFDPVSTQEEAFNRNRDQAVFDLPDDKLKQLGAILGVKQSKNQSRIAFVERITERPGSDVRSAYLTVAQPTQPITGEGAGVAKPADTRLVPVSKRTEQNQPPALANTAQPAIESVAEAGPVGRNNVPLSEGGKPYKTKLGADTARKTQPMMRVQRVAGGYALIEKTPAQIAAQEKAAKRLSQPRTSPKGEPIPAHAMIAAAGGLHPNTRADMGMQGNVNVGNRKLFAGVGRGLTIEQATEKLIEEGYLQEGAGHDQARALIKRSLTNPQYTPEGTERMAEKELQEREKAFNDEQEALALAQEADDTEYEATVAAFEAAMLNEPQAEAQGDMSMEDALLAAGYTKQEIDNERSETEAIGPDAGAAGALAQNGQGAAEAAPGRGAQGDAGRDGAAREDQGSGEGLTLTAPSRQEVLAQQAAIDAEAKRKEEGGDKPIPRKQLTGDIPDLFNPQGSVFDVPEEPTPAAEATAILDAANVTGKERIDALKDVKKGDITPEELQAAYPAKEDKFPSTAQGAIDAFNADDSAQAVAIMAKLKLDDLKEVGGAIGFRPQNGENAKSFRERIGTVADKLTLTNRKQTSNEMKLHTRLTQLASDYDRAIAHRDRAIANGAEAGSSAFEGQYEGQWTTIDKGLEILENALREESKSPDYAKVSAMVKEARPAIFDAAKPDNSAKPEAKSELADFGEALPGARKDAAPSLKTELSDNDIATQPLSKIWPADEYLTIEDKFAAAIAFAARSEVPAKPRTAYKVKSWVERVKVARGLAQRITSGEVSRERMAAEMAKTRSLSAFADKVALLEAIDKADWPRIDSVEVYPDAYRYNEDGTQTKTPLVRVSIDGRSRSFDGATSVADVVERVSAMLGTEVQQEKRMAFEVRGTASKGFAINKKGDKEYRKLKTFPTAKEALDFVKTGYAELVAEWEGVKDRDNVKEEDVRGTENRPRTAKDYRNGKDVTSEQFAETFGFRGGQFGNWVNQGEGRKDRQGMLNQAYDALMDLADIVGVPPKAISLNGSLGIAFGARGSGKASAHYEPDTLVINLTKTRGAGVLAHEWFHALDNYFSHQRGGAVPMTPGMSQLDYRKANYITYKPEPLYVHKTKQSTPITKATLDRYAKTTNAAGYYNPENWHLDPRHPEGVRPEVERRIAELVEALNASPMAQRAAMNDKAPEGYWSRIIERAARSFENYVISKMMERGYHNDYLANVREVGDFPRSKERYPYLLPEEVKPIAEAFDNLFATVQTKETDKGVAMFARGNTQNTGLTPAQFTAELAKAFGAKVAERLQAKGVVVPLADQSKLPAHVVPFLRDGDIIYGFYDPKTDRTYAVLENLTPEMVKGLTLHEVGVHFGFKSMLGEAKYNSVMKRLDFMRRAGNKAVKEAYAEAQKNSVRDSQVPEETLAYLVQSSPKMGIIKEIIARIKAFLFSEFGIGGKYLTEADLTMLARAAVDHSSRMEEGGSVVPAFSRKVDQTESEAFKRWFGDSKVVDSTGKPMVVYHGTTKDFGEFLPGTGYFTADAFEANMYGGFNDAGANVVPAYLSIKKPRVIESETMTGTPRDVIADALTDGSIDGVIVTEGGKVRWAVVTEPNQIKSATGNNGDFDGTNPDIRFSRTPTDDIGLAYQGMKPPGDGARLIDRKAANPHSWDAPEPSQFDDLVYRLQDKQIDTKRVTQAIRELSGQLADEKDVYLQEELFHGRAAARTEDFINKELGPLVTEMKMRGIDIPTLDEYLHARHAEEANALIADREPSMPDGGSGMTNKAARDYMAKLPAAERQRLEAVAAKVDAILGKTRQMYADYHLESDATVKGWGQMFKHYVPLMREDKDGGMGIGQGFSIKGKETKGRTGSTRKVVDILANIAMQRERAIVRGEKNHVATALVGLAKSNPNPEFWYTGPPPTERVYDPKTNTVVDRADPLYKSRENVVVAKIKQPSGEVKEVAVSFNEDNERAMRMAAALKNLDASQLNGVLGVSAKITRYFAAINTQYNPIFGTVNLVRDFQGALLNLSTTPLKSHKTEIAGHTLSALKGIYLDARAARDGKPQTSAWATLWEEFQAEGGQTGYRDMFASSNDRAKAIEHELNPTKWMDSPLGKVFTAGGALKVPLSIAQKKATGLFNWLSDYNLAMENAVRLSAYKVGLEQGMSKQQAASLAKNLTVNFNRKGQVGQQAGALYAFFNASMQGSARLGKTLFDMDGQDVKSIRLSSTGKKIVYGGMLLGTMQALLLAAAGFDDEEPPDFVRERSLIIPTGGKSYITIPMPLGLHVLPNMGRIPTEFALGGFKQPAKHIAKLLGLTANAFNPVGGGASLVQMLSPTAVDPIVALAENKDWTGKPIAKTSYNKATPGHALVKDTASAPSKVLSEAINLMTGGTKYTAGVFSPTPDQIDYLWGQATGGVGRELSKVQQTASATITGEDLPVHKIPLVGRFYGNAETQSAQSSKFYATINRLNEHEAEIKGLQKDRKSEELSEYLADNPEARLFKMANAVELDVQKMRRMKRELLAIGAPQERIKALEERITARMTQFNQTAARLKTARETATAQ